MIGSRSFGPAFMTPSLKAARAAISKASALELTGAAGLLLVCIVSLGDAGDRLTIGNLRRADIGVHLEFALHPVDDDLEVEFAHSLDHRLTALMVHCDAE